MRLDIPILIIVVTTLLFTWLIGWDIHDVRERLVRIEATINEK